MEGNDLLVGWRQIAKFLGMSERSVRGYRRALLEGRRIFYKRQKLGKKYVCAWPDDLRQWAKRR